MLLQQMLLIFDILGFFTYYNLDANVGDKFKIENCSGTPNIIGF